MDAAGGRLTGVQDLLEDCIVQVTVDGRPRGTGFFVTPRHVLTCAHVVAPGHDEPSETYVRVRHGDCVRVRIAKVAGNAGSSLFAYPDLALLEVVDDGFRSTLVAWLDPEVPQPEDTLVGRGYSQSLRQIDALTEPVRLGYIGLHRLERGSLLSLGGAEIVEGMSGAPLINDRTGRVCAVLKTTRGRDGAHGGWAIPIASLGELDLSVLPENAEHHSHDGSWRRRLPQWSMLTNALFDKSPWRPANLTPSFLLRSEFEVVPFRKRDNELRALTAWCSTRNGPPVRLLTGAAGQGKTRLAAQLCQLMTERGWLAGQLRTSVHSGAVESLMRSGFESLLVIDYAETRIPQVTDVVTRLSETDGAAERTRLLLLARSPGEWWEGLRNSSASLQMLLLNDPDPPLPALEQSVEGRRDAFLEAMRAFSRATGSSRVPSPAAVPDLAEPSFGSVLVLHMAALAALLSAEPGTADDAPQGATDVSSYLLGHERRYWEGTARRAGLDRLGAAMLRHCVAAATLCGAATEDEAIGLLCGIGQLRDSPPQERRPVARWLATLYPHPTHFIGPLQPDRFGEDLISEVVSEAPQLIASLIERSAPGQIYRALTVLDRAALRHSTVTAFLSGLIGLQPSELSAIGVSVAVQSKAPVGLVEGVRQVLPRLTEGELLDVLRRIPARTVMLSALAVEVCQEALNRVVAGGSPLQQTAYLLTLLSMRQAGAGSRHDSLRSAVRAVKAYRLLADLTGGEADADFALCLSNYSVRLSAFGKRVEALAAIREAVDVYRLLVRDGDDAHLPQLGTALNCLSAAQADVGMREAALESARAALDVFESLLARSGGGYAPDHAISLNNVSVRLAGVGMRDDAAAMVRLAVSAHRKLAELQPDAYLADLSVVLNNSAAAVADLGRRGSALQLAEEAVSSSRRLVLRSAAVFDPDLILSLNNLSNRLAAVGRIPESLVVIDEAVERARRLAQEDPNAYLPDLALSLNNQSNRLADSLEFVRARGAAEEAVAINRELIVSDRDAFYSELALSLGNLSNRLAALAAHDEAVTIVREAARIGRDLAAERPGAFLFDLAAILNNQSMVLASMGDYEGALAAGEEALTQCRTLDGQHGVAFKADLGLCLLTVSHAAAMLGRTPEAEHLVCEAAEVFAGLSAGDPGAYGLELAYVEWSTAIVHSAGGGLAGPVEAASNPPGNWVMFVPTGNLSRLRSVRLLRRMLRPLVPFQMRDQFPSR